MDYSKFGCPVLEDRLHDFGPLAGIARGLEVATQPLLLVLAVDMANMDSGFLKKLLARCADGVGAVPVCGEIIEPLAAFYPKSATSLVQKLVAQSEATHPPGAKHFAELCVQAGLVRLMSVPPEEAALFKSWNTPEDLPARADAIRDSAHS